MNGYSNVSFFSDNRAKAVLCEGVVPVTDDGDEVLSQMVTVTIGNQPELILWIDDILSIVSVLHKVQGRALERMEQFCREDEVCFPQRS